jgi:nitrite reductase/ring-hydroxylating ferredoxin subunit
MSSRDESRRAFLQSSGCLALAIAAAAALPGELFAQPVSFVDGTGSRDERRYPIPAADGGSIDRVEQVILVRQQNLVFALNLSCPHQGAAVRWVENARRFQCTKHDSQYQPDGVYVTGRATRNMDRLPIRRDGATVVVNLDRIIQSDADPPGWAAAVVTLP